MQSTETSIPSSRIRSLDGLRGIAIVLVVLSHIWTLAPMKWIYDQAALHWLFNNGDYAVSIFFVVGGYFIGVGLLASTELNSAKGTARWILRRVLRISTSVYALLAAIMIVSVLDSTEVYTADQTRNSVVRIMTYTWNWWVMRNALFARSDLGHLWYLSVYVQVMICLAIAFFVLRRFRPVLFAFLTAGMVASTVWRAHILHTEDLYQALLRTTSRMDGMMWGALLAVGLTFVTASGTVWLKRRAAVISAVGLIVCLAILITTKNPASYFGARGIAFNIGMCLAIAGLIHIDRSHVISSATSWQPIAKLGEWSLSIYVWHYPILWAISRHSADWHWATRLALALVLTALASTASQRFIDTPTKNWLKTHLITKRLPASSAA